MACACAAKFRFTKAKRADRAIKNAEAFSRFGAVLITFELESISQLPDGIFERDGIYADESPN